MALPALLAGGLATALVSSLASAGGQIALRVLATLGIGYITYSGADTLVSSNKDAVMSALSGLPSQAIAMIGVLKVGVCLNIMQSALVARLAYVGVSGAAKRIGPV